MAVRIDLHCHSFFSGDGVSSPEQLIEAARHKGLHGFAMTDHNTCDAVKYMLDKGLMRADGLPVDGFLVLPGVEVKLADDGEILARGANVAKGAIAEDGWLHTGDLGALDADGRLTITGRNADTIVTGGENVAPAEVEDALLEHPSVADAAVFGRADGEWGEAIVAKVVLRVGAAAVAPTELREHCAQRLAPFKVPKQVELVQSLPRSESGKLLRRGL